jgi:hypothetical protein
VLHFCQAHNVSIVSHAIMAGAQAGGHCGEGGEVKAGQAGHWPAEVDALHAATFGV